MDDDLKRVVPQATQPRRTLAAMGWLGIFHIGPPITCPCILCKRTKNDAATGGVFLTGYAPLQDVPLCVDCMTTLLRDAVAHIKEKTGKDIDL